MGSALLAGDSARARTVAEQLAALFPGRFYIELQRGGLPAHEPHVRAAVALREIQTRPSSLPAPDVGVLAQSGDVVVMWPGEGIPRRYPAALARAIADQVNAHAHVYAVLDGQQKAPGGAGA